jgi:hypothetical protein
MGVRYPRSLICHVNSEEKKRRSLKISRSDIVWVPPISRRHVGHLVSTRTALDTRKYVSHGIYNLRVGISMQRRTAATAPARP